MPGFDLAPPYDLSPQTPKSGLAPGVSIPDTAITAESYRAVTGVVASLLATINGGNACLAATDFQPAVVVGQLATLLSSGQAFLKHGASQQWVPTSIGPTPVSGLPPNATTTLYLHLDGTITAAAGSDGFPVCSITTNGTQMVSGTTAVTGRVNITSLLVAGNALSELAGVAAAARANIGAAALDSPGFTGTPTTPAVATASLPVIDVTHPNYGAVADGKEALGLSITSGAAALSGPAATFAAADAGKHIVVQGAGAYGPKASLKTTIVSVSSDGSTATLADTAAVTCTGTANAYWGTDQTAALQAALNEVNVLGSGRVYLPYKGTGRYWIGGTAGLALTSTGADVELFADPGVVLDARSCTNNVLQLAGQLGSSVALGSVATAADYQIVLASPFPVRPKEGDLLYLTTLDYANANLTDLSPSVRFSVDTGQIFACGEMMEIESVSADGLTIALRTGLFSSYLISSTFGNPTVVYQILSAPAIRISNIVIEGDSGNSGAGGTGGLIVRYGKNIAINNCRISGTRNFCYDISFCFGGEIANCKSSDCWFSGTPESYGLDLDCCQYVTIRSNVFRGGRHSITIGGNAFPTRGLVFLGNTTNNYHLSGQLGIVTHDGCDKCTWIGNNIEGGFNWLGADILCIGNRFNGMQNVAVLLQQAPQNISHQTFIGNQILGGSAAFQLQPFLAGIQIACISLIGNVGVVGGSILQIIPSSSAVTGVVIDRLELYDNDLKTTTGSGNLINASASGGTKVQINSMDWRGGYYESAFHGFNLPTAALVASTLRCSGVRFKIGIANSSVVGSISAFTDAFLKDCLFACSPNGSQNFFDNTGVLYITGCKFSGWNANAGINVAGPTLYIQRDNYFSSTSGSASIAAGTRWGHMTINSGANVLGYGTAAPTAGTWVTGDEILNLAPVAGGNAGWICVAGGTPGTWLRFGGVELSANATWDPPSVAAGASTTTTIAVTGAVVGDFVTGISLSTNTGTQMLGAEVAGAGTVTVVLFNPTSGAVDLASGTLRVRVAKQ